MLLTILFLTILVCLAYPPFRLWVFPLLFVLYTYNPSAFWVLITILLLTAVYVYYKSQR
jgi:hypothetical protein